VISSRVFSAADENRGHLPRKAIAGLLPGKYKNNI
jgi:hypothetical protein